MKKKICLALILCIMATMLCGCSFETEYPYIEVINDIWKLNNLKIPITDDYILNTDKPYEITRNDVNDSMIVTIYFRKDEK